MKQIPIVADVHMHTWHSHGQASTHDMYLAAVQAGLKIIGFSEHSPRPQGFAYKQDYQEKLCSVFPQYVKEVKDLQEHAKADGVQVLFGLELDYIKGQEDFARIECAKYPYDYIIGGLHFQDTWGFDGPAEEWLPLSKEERFAVYAKYYQDLASMCQTKLFNIAAHPDLVKISSRADFDLWLSTDESMPLIAKALTAIKDNGMAMEISSAGLRKKCKEIYPGEKIMELAKNLHLSISFGADAHCTGTPAYAFDELARYAHAFGYTHSLVFVGGKAVKVPFSQPALI